MYNNSNSNSNSLLINNTFSGLSSDGQYQTIIMRKPNSIYGYKLYCSQDSGDNWKITELSNLLSMYAVIFKPTDAGTQESLLGVFRREEQAIRFLSERRANLSLDTNTDNTHMIEKLAVHGNQIQPMVTLNVCGQRQLLIYDGIIMNTVDGGLSWSITNPEIYIGIKKDGKCALIYANDSYKNHEGVPLSYTFRKMVYLNGYYQ